MCLSLRYVKASLIWSISSAGMKLRVFLVYTEPSTMRIGEAGFDQISKHGQFSCPWFRAPDTIFCRKTYFSATGTLLCRKIEISMLYFSPNSLLTLHRTNVLKKGKTTTSYLSPSWHATCVVASNLRSPEFGCITYAEGEYSISILCFS